MLLLYLGKLKILLQLCSRYEKNANKLLLSALNLIPLRSLLSMLSVFMCKETEYSKQTIQAHLGIAIFIPKFVG